jgi:16S rRNA (adenine1518-N6/adenine1519-N6)-dimethyltransferase
MKLSEMKEALAAGGLRLTKSLGQNFLHDQNQLRRIVAAAELGSRDRVLEIGPGLGPLTELLLPAAGKVLAIEKDRRLFEILRQRFAAAQNLELRHDDAMEFLRRERRDWSDWKVVSNLPYSVASVLLVELALCAGPPRRIVVTLQLEVAQRLVARPGGDDYGVLTLLLQLRYELQGQFKIPASCFFPAPEVDSACVTLVRRERSLLAPELLATFVRLVKQAFSQRRKMMLKLLREHWPEARLQQTLADLQIAPETRAEAVTLEQFVRLTERLGSPSVQ